MKNFIINVLKNNFWLYRQIILEIDSSVVNNLNIFINNISWRYANSKDILNMMQDGDMGIDKKNCKYFNAISNDKNLMLVGEINAKIIAYVCVVFGKKIFMKRYFKLFLNEGFVLASFTNPKFRGRGIGVQALTELRKRLIIDNPDLHLFCHVNCSNKSSLRMFEKAGYVTTNTNLYRIQFLKWNFVFQNGKFCHRFVNDLKVCQPEKDFINENSQ